jgi:hypothetical protein
VTLRIPSTAIVLGLALVSVSLAGCTSGTSGAPTAAPTSSGTSASAPSTGNGAGGAPRVAHPLDASKLITQPCVALTAADVTGLNIVNAISKPVSDANGSQCTWSGDSGGGVSIGWVTTNTNGLADLYSKSSTIAYWQPTTVAGYPAAYGDALSDGRSQGDCVINTAVSDKLYFGAQFDNPLNPGKSCALAAQAATDVIKNLGGS